MEKKARVLVTGASGFLGKNTIPLLEKHGYIVETLGRGAAPFPDLKHYTLDISRETPTEAVMGADAIVHLASDVSIAASIQNPSEYIKNTLSITLNVLEACRQSKRAPLFVFLSSDRVYGKESNTVNEQSPVFPIEPYVATKIMGETAVATYGHLLTMPYIVLRASAFFGPHQPRRGFIADIICKMLEQDKIVVGPLQGVKNFTYVCNVADAILASLTAEEAARNCIYNIGGEPLSLTQVLEDVRTIIQSLMHRTIRVDIDHSIQIPTKHDIGPFTLSTNAAKKHLHWKERVTLQEGLEETIDYFRRTLKNPNNT